MTSDPRRLARDLETLADGYTASAWTPDGRRWHHEPGLYTQLVAALGQPTSRGNNAGRHTRPGSRPPGWNADVSELLRVIRDGLHTSTHTGVIRALHTARRTTAAAAAANHPCVTRFADDVHEWVRQARVLLGHVIPSVELPSSACRRRVLTAAGWRTVGCGHPLRVAADGRSDVWCANPACHDSTTHPDCQLRTDGTWSCRETSRDLRHCQRWAHDQWFEFLDAEATA
jgi:hypothetical protein